MTSLDGYMYCLNERKGNIVWRFTTGEPILNSPVALDTRCMHFERGNMFAIDVNTAAERWVTSGIRSYLAGNDKRLYCLDDRGDLAILDADERQPAGQLAGAAGEFVPMLNNANRPHFPHDFDRIGAMLCARRIIRGRSCITKSSRNRNKQKSLLPRPAARQKRRRSRAKCRSVRRARRSGPVVTRGG